MRKVIIFLYVVLLRTELTFIINILYWARHLKDIKKARAEKKEYKSYAEYMYGIISIMKRHKWTSDAWNGALDWSPWPLTMINKQFRDDCDGAARMARWLSRSCSKVESAHEYIVIEGWSMATSHVIVIGKMKDSIKWFIFSNSDRLEANSRKAIIDLYEKSYPIDYNNPVYYKLR